MKILRCILLSFIVFSLFPLTKLKCSKEDEVAMKIKLPEVKIKANSLEEIIKNRRSVRKFSKEPLTLDELSYLLFAANGITQERSGYKFRSAPSAGALYPVEVYAVINNVEGLDRGLYYYDVDGHSLELLKKEDLAAQLMNACLGQSMAQDAAAIFVLSAVAKRITSKYGERGIRYMYIEAGHISQNIYLEAENLCLGSVVIGAFSDDKVNKILGVDGKTEQAIYLHAVGRIK